MTPAYTKPMRPSETITPTTPPPRGGGTFRPYANETGSWNDQGVFTPAGSRPPMPSEIVFEQKLINGIPTFVPTKPVTRPNQGSGFPQINTDISFAKDDPKRLASMLEKLPRMAPQNMSLRPNPQVTRYNRQVTELRSKILSAISNLGFKAIDDESAPTGRKRFKLEPMSQDELNRRDQTRQSALSQKTQAPPPPNPSQSFLPTTPAEPSDPNTVIVDDNTPNPAWGGATQPSQGANRPINPTRYQEASLDKERWFGKPNQAAMPAKGTPRDQPNRSLSVGNTYVQPVVPWQEWSKQASPESRMTIEELNTRANKGERRAWMEREKRSPADNFTGKSIYARTTPDEAWELEKAASRGDKKAKAEIKIRKQTLDETGNHTLSITRPALDRLHGKTDSPAIREAAEFAKSGANPLNKLAQIAVAGTQNISAGNSQQSKPASKPKPIPSISKPSNLPSKSKISTIGGHLAPKPPALAEYKGLATSDFGGGKQGLVAAPQIKPTPALPPGSSGGSGGGQSNGQLIGYLKKKKNKEL